MLNKYVSSVFKNHVYVDCLFLSCSIGSRTLIKFLLEKGLKPDVLSRRQFTALHLAAYRVCLMKPQNATQLIVSVLPISWQNIIWKFLLVINFLCYLKNIDNFKSEVLVTHFQYRIFTQSHTYVCHWYLMEPPSITDIVDVCSTGTGGCGVCPVSIGKSGHGR